MSRPRDEVSSARCTHPCRRHTTAHTGPLDRPTRCMTCDETTERLGGIGRVCPVAQGLSVDRGATRWLVEKTDQTTPVRKCASAQEPQGRQVNNANKLRSQKRADGPIDGCPQQTTQRTPPPTTSLRKGRRPPPGPGVGGGVKFGRNLPIPPGYANASRSYGMIAQVPAWSMQRLGTIRQARRTPPLNPTRPKDLSGVMADACGWGSVAAIRCESLHCGSRLEYPDCLCDLPALNA